MRRLYRFFLLPYQEKKLLTRALFLIVIVRIGLWLVPFRLLERWLTLADAPNIGEKDPDWVTVKSVVRSVRSCSLYVPYATCLTQALATRVLLRMDGQNSSLKIGVEKDRNEKFGAHAWIEVDGRIVMGKHPHHHRFAVLRSNSAFL